MNKLHSTVPVNFWVLLKIKIQFLKFSMGLRSGYSGAGHSVTSIIFVWNQDVARLLLCLGGVLVLLKHPFQGHFLFGIRQHKLLDQFEYIKILWYIQTDPWSLVYAKEAQHHSMKKKSPHHASLSSSTLRLEFSTWGSPDRQTTPRQLYSSVHRMLCHFS